MPHFPAFQSILFLFLFIQNSICNSIEVKRLNTSLTRLILRQDNTQLDVAQLQYEFEQLRNEVHQARQQVDVLSNIINDMKINGSGENKCSCETKVNLTNELQGIPHHRINDSEIILKLESFSRKWTDEVSENKRMLSTANEIAIGFRQEKQRRKYFEMRTDASLFAINDTIFSMNQTCQSNSLKNENESIEKMNSTLQRLIVDLVGIQSSIRNIQNDTYVLASTSHSQSVIIANSLNTTGRNDAEIRKISSELQSLKSVIENMSRGQTSIPETATTSFTTMAGTKSLVSHLCARTVTDETLILNSIKVGSRVVRGKDWAWGSQDGIPPTAGKVDKVDSLPGWVWVRWDSGMYVNYRVGESGKFDLFICE